MTMALSLTPRAFARLFPHASKSTFAANGIASQDYAPSLPDAEPEREPLQALDGGAPGEKEGAQRAHLRIRRFGCRLLDDDNLTGGAKPLIDCLKEAGLIVDDSPKWCTIAVTQEKVTNKAHERTEIEITYE